MIHPICFGVLAIEFEPYYPDPALAELRAAHLAYLNRRIPALSPREIRELVASVRVRP